MNIHAPASHRNPARAGEPDAAGASPQEIKYREDAAGYVAAMLAELRQIAGKAGFEKLVKSLDAAYYEAYGALDARGRETAPPPRVAGPQAGNGDGAEKISKSVEPNGA